MQGSEEFSAQVFDALARRRGITAQLLTRDQVLDFWEQLSNRSFDARLQTFFDMVDKNADGQITKDEIKEMLQLTASASNLTRIEEKVDEYASLLMEVLDPENLGYIEVQNLQNVLLPVGQSQLQQESDLAGTTGLVPTKEGDPIRRLGNSFSYFLSDNWKRIWVMTLWLCICFGLFTWKFKAYKRNPTFQVMGYCVTTAKGGAETTKLNMAIILLPVCRNLITWLRSHTKLGLIIPFNDNLNFHKVIAWGVAVGAGLHIIPHLTCDFPRILHETDEEYSKYLAQFFGSKRPPNYWWFVKGVEGITGLILTICMVIMYVLAQPLFRRGKLSEKSKLRQLTGFNTFWYSHHLFIVVYITFIVHGVCLYINRTWYKKTTWMYLLVPMTLYICERILRILRAGYKKVSIQKVVMHRGNVLAIYMTKPHGFKYKSGQYIFVNCAAVSPFEWHPFSITSAPGDEYLSIHMRCRGDWTLGVRNSFREFCQAPTSGQSGLLRANFTDGNASPPKLLIDGPYGAAAQDYWKYDVLLLIGLGIGATPLVSIIKDTLNNYQAKKNELHGDKTSSNYRRHDFVTERAYFYWVTREEGSFEWFRGLMDDAADKDNEGIIELHNHCTSVYERGDARSALLVMLQELYYAKHEIDILGQTRVRTHFARPNWNKVFKSVAQKHPDKRVGVFYCGDRSLERELKWLSQDFSHKTSTRFVFHKENF
ncbi:hypothetical protein LUZ61_017664 [Rhynchospora tenuis]|uniref:NADPH oxidase n=1 Tax=Rhynchospora tenuis TaxID=198213 RepID=A0AAD6EL75_9POAL|nr:hypothetical protein LUZ61_017664 [Rhynchospora tenuis]